MDTKYFKLKKRIYTTEKGCVFNDQGCYMWDFNDKEIKTDWKINDMIEDIMKNRKNIWESCFFNEYFEEVQWDEKEEVYNFPFALEKLKDWERITRKWWNGKWMYLYLVPANIYKAETVAAMREFWNDWVPYNAYIAMKNAQWTICMWSASNSDLLEEDWIIL